MNAFRPVYARSSPVPPAWHAPAEQLTVAYPQPVFYPGYGRRKDASLYGLYGGAAYEVIEEAGYGPAGSLAYAPSGFASFGEDAPVKSAAKTYSADKAAKVKLKDLFKKDESGVSKGEQIAKRGIDLFRKAPPPPPAPVVQSSQPQVNAMQVVLVGLVGLGVGMGAGYMLGSRR